MCHDGAAFDVSFLTASRFHFIAGPFVGSPDNSFLKYAFYSGARDLYVLIDGSKVICNAGLLAEWLGCFWPFGAHLPDHMLSKYIGGLFPRAGRAKRERLMQAVEDAADRNPQSCIGFPSVFVPTRTYEPSSNLQDNDDTTEEIKPVSSWPKCVEQVMSRRGGGKVSICIAQPDKAGNDFQRYLNKGYVADRRPSHEHGTSIDFERFLRKAILEANRFLRSLKSPLRVEPPERADVYLRPETRTLCDTGNIEGCVKVSAWRCTYAKRLPQDEPRISQSQAYDPIV
jgi:hypothetical protein